MLDDGKFLILSLSFINTDHLIFNSEDKFLEENTFINVTFINIHFNYFK